MNNGLLISTLRAMNEDGVNHVGYAADVIEALQKQLHEEHEAHLIAEQKWIEQLAACQASEKVLRDALEIIQLGEGSYLHRNRETNVRFSLRDLGDGPVRRNEKLPACSFFCELAEQEYAA